MQELVLEQVSERLLQAARPAPTVQVQVQVPKQPAWTMVRKALPAAKVHAMLRRSMPHGQ